MSGSVTTSKAPTLPIGIFEDTQRYARIFTLFTILILGSELVGILTLLSNHNFLQALITAANLPLVLGAFFFIGRKQFEMAAIFLAIVLFTLISIISTLGLGIHNISNLGFPAILIVASLVIRRRTLILLNVYALVCIAWLVFGEILGIYTPGILVKSVWGDFISASTILITTSVMVRTLTRAVFRSSVDAQNELAERKRAEEGRAYDALHDTLSGLPNRALFMDRLGQRLEFSRRHPLRLFAVLVIDLDRFKVVNDSLGHEVGDQMLIGTARRLALCLRPEDTVSRLSGDEFGVLLNDINDSSDVVRVAERIQTQLAATPLIDNVNRITTASIGVTVSHASYSQAQDMLRDADAAMYRAKAQGGGHTQIFDESMYANAMALMQMEAELKRAVENREWEIYYQPVIALPGRQMVGVEALVRWNHPVRGICLPGEFIHIAEETGLILPIGEFVVREACRQLKIWREGLFPELWMSINLSGRQFQDKLLVKKITQILAENELPGEGVRLEITESVAMKNTAYSARVMEELSQLGIQISLDDFGNGYSSLGYLNRFPLKTLKIDRSFILNNEISGSNDAIRTAIISLGHALHMEVIAEGVETEAQLESLGAASCDMIQGYLFSKALPARELEQLLSGV